MLKLAAFADEISPNFDVQIEHLKKNGVPYIELRAAGGKNVLKFTPEMRQEIKSKIANNGIGIACIGSPIGKVKIAEPFAPHFDNFKLAVETAEYFGAPLIRVFSYYGSFPADRDEVMRRLQMQVDYIKGHPVTLVHENEKDIYGEKGPACLDIHKTIKSPQFKAAFDFANFVQAGDNPADNWPLLKPFTAHIHIKDALQGTGKVVPAGQGDGHVAEILKDAYTSGYRGFLSLEPHLMVAGHSSGETGPDLFKVAVDALRKICREQNIPLAPFH